MGVLITGITGFAGSHLAEMLLARGEMELFGVARNGRWPNQCRHLSNAVTLHACDLCDRASLATLLGEVRPEHIYHLAGYAHAGRSFDEPDAAWAGNLTATRYLYEAVDTWGGKTRILSVGSGLVYGESETFEEGQDESTPLAPLSPYASSKAAADLLGYQFWRTAGLDIVRVRPFNHIGPRQSPDYAVAHFAKQIAAIELGRQPPRLQTGNLSPRRDLTDVRDMVRAYVLLMERGRVGEVYNAGSGETHSMREVLDHLLAKARVPIQVEQEEGLVRATETNVVRANATKLRQETGWAPQYTLQQTLADILAHFRTAM